MEEETVIVLDGNKPIRIKKNQYRTRPGKEFNFLFYLLFFFKIRKAMMKHLLHEPF